jgi:glycosyltransferase involved in cell wall biosynthesis
MVILTTTYNCENFVERSLMTIMSQRYGDFKCYITDDMSTDGTVDVVKKTIQNDPRFVLIQNSKKMYQPGNYDQIIRGMNIKDNEVCIEVDGDDWLPNSNVFGKIAEIYSEPEVWMTSGSFKYHDGRQGFAQPPHSFNQVRSLNFTLSHLRTWRAWLWNRIDPQDLRDENGEYWSVAGDLAFMYPMFEMAGPDHFKFISDILYVYNESNPLNDHKVNMGKVMESVNKLRAKQPYERL